MTTPSPDRTETLEEIAERIARDWFPEQSRSQNRMALKNDILSCLRNERGRAAKLTDDILPIGADDCYWCERVKKASTAIRKGR